MEHDELEELFGAEWAEWMRLTPAERFAAQDQMWATFLEMGGSFDPEPDPQSPFFDEDEWRANLTDGRAGCPLGRMRVLRRGGV